MEGSMKKIFNWKRFVAVFMAIIVLAACKPTSKEENVEPKKVETVDQKDSEAKEEKKEEDKETKDAEVAKIEFTDMAGNKVSLDAPVKKVVVLTPSDCEILYAIGAGDAVIGRGTYCDYPEEVKSVKELTSGKDTNIEEIIALEPDAVVMSMMSQTEDHVRALEKAGIKVIVSDATSIEQVYQAIQMIGKATGREGAAENLIKEMESTFEEYKKKAKGKEGGKIYYEVSPLEYGLWTAGNKTFMDEIGNIIGVKNVFTDVTGWTEISEEQIIERNPDHIVTITMYFGEGPKPDEEILGRNGWGDINAIKNKSVFMANADEFSRPGPRLKEAVKALYDFIYNE